LRSSLDQTALYATLPLSPIHKFRSDSPIMNGANVATTLVGPLAQTTEERMAGMDHSEVRYFTRQGDSILSSWSHLLTRSLATTTMVCSIVTSSVPAALTFVGKGIHEEMLVSFISQSLEILLTCCRKMKSERDHTGMRSTRTNISSKTRSSSMLAAALES
jgi:hypothetical protein